MGGGKGRHLWEQVLTVRGMTKALLLQREHLSCAPALRDPSGDLNLEEFDH